MRDLTPYLRYVYLFYFLKTCIFYLQLSSLHWPDHWTVQATHCWLSSGRDVGVFPWFCFGWWVRHCGVTGQGPVVDQCHRGAAILCRAWLWADGSWEVVMELLPNELSSRLTFCSVQWKSVCPLVISLVGLLFIFIFAQSARKQLYGRYEKQLSETLDA